MQGQGVTASESSISRRMNVLDVEHSSLSPAKWLTAVFLLVAVPFIGVGTTVLAIFTAE